MLIPLVTAQLVEFLYHIQEVVGVHISLVPSTLPVSISPPTTIARGGTILA